MGFSVLDDSMFPIIPKDRLVTLEVRIWFFKDDVLLICPINTGFESEMIKLTDVTILGK